MERRPCEATAEKEDHKKQQQGEKTLQNSCLLSTFSSGGHFV